MEEKEQALEEKEQILKEKEQTVEELVWRIAQSGSQEKIDDIMRGYMRLMTYYNCAIREIETKFHVMNAELSLQYDRNPICAIKSRIKRPKSIQAKLLQRQCPLTLESIEKNLNDIAGIRVVCSFVEDVYAIAESLLKQDDIRLIQRKDYILEPKKNGYRSLHLIVEIPIFLTREKRNMKVEVQLRTIAMDCWADLEHQLRYKKDALFTAEMDDQLNYCARLCAALDGQMSSLGRAVGIFEENL